MPGAIGDAQGIDLNTASREQLERVGGLGSDRAQKIMQQRPIRSWDEFKRIDGFSDTLVDDLRRAGASLGQKAA
jgi:DNA uptake protein ComE-like DNA-binding protein